ncbi:hypothetical protein Nm8I071_13220 [Nonomuraea sp. TT08I-71]|nr:hypothetical protein Nm8I071_13220 [Nonomuraea sp. TT08I-71]
MTPDPTTPLPAEPPPPAAYDPWSAMPPAVAPPTEQFPVLAAPPADPPVSAPPTARFPAAPPAVPAVPAAPPFPAAPTAAPFPATPAPPAQFSAPPAQFAVPPATAQFSAPPGQFAVPPGAPAGVPAPHGGALMPAQSVVAVQIGEIMVTPPVIRTPAGVLPLAGSSWHVMDHWQKEEKVATWAVVAAILGFFCLTVFSLLFLLVKETRHHGTVQVTVTNGGHQYVARIPVADQFQVQQINNQVNYARSLSTG